MSSLGGDAKELFLDALELAGDARARFLAEIAGREPEVAARVAALLAAHEGGGANALESLGSSLRGMLRGAVGAVITAGAVVGDYELLEEIASGASGVVWRARQRSLDRVVALKVLRAGCLAGSREVERFRAEAETVARFDHPHIVPVYEVGEHEGRHFFSMRFFAGGSLADRVGRAGRADRHGRDLRWEPRAAAEMVRTIASAVHHAHQRGLLHRDLKPSNVLLDEHGSPAVADFGVAAHIDDAGIAAVTTTLAGTPAYMAPEQTGPNASGSGELTVATDVWALGCILYELLAGRPPFAADSLSGILAKVRDELPMPLRALAPDTPRDLETIVLRCLAKEPARRYASANGLAIDLGRWLEHEPILARRTGPLERLALAWRRNPVVASLAVLVVLLLAALAVGASWAQVKLEARLREAYLGEARATRLSDGQGRRAHALALLAKAARLRPGPDVRDEAIACLATTDLRTLATLRFEIGAAGPADVDAALERLAYGPAGPGEGGIVVLALPDGRELARLAGADRCDALRLSRDGRRIVAKFPGAGPAGGYELRVYSVDDGAVLLRVPRGWAAGAVSFDAAARFVAIGDADGRVTVWNLATGEPTLDLVLDGYVGAALLNADASQLALAASDGETATVTLRALPSGELTHALELPRYVFALAWMPGEGSLIASSSDYSAYVVDVASAEPRLTLTGHRAEVIGAVVSPATPLVATSSWDRTMRLWDLESGESLVRISAEALGFSPDGSRLAYRTIGSFEVAEVVHGGILRTLHGHAGKSPAGVAFARDGERLFSFGVDGAIAWDLRTGRSLGRLTDEKIDGIEAAPDGRALYISGSGGLERRSASAPFERGEVLLPGDQDQCDLSADGRLLAVRDDLTLQLIDPGHPGAAGLIEGYPGFEYVAASARATYVAGMTWQGPGMTLWRAADGAVLARLREDRNALGAAISPDETRLVVGDGVTYEVYSLPDVRLVQTIRRDVAMRESPAMLAYTEDGALLALGLTVDTLGLFDGHTLAPVARLEARGATFDGRTAFSPDGTKLAIASGSNRVYVWDLTKLRAGLADVGIAWD